MVFNLKGVMTTWALYNLFMEIEREVIIMPPRVNEVYRFINGTGIAFSNNPNVYFDHASLYNEPKLPRIKKVIFNDPATIVFWRDDTKTVVKCDPTEQFDPEKGLAMAIAKKALGNKGNYFNEIKKWTEEYEAEHMFDNCIYAGSNLKELRDFHFSSTIDKAINQLKKDLGIKSPSEKCGFNKED